MHIIMYYGLYLLTQFIASTIFDLNIDMATTLILVDD